MINYILVGGVGVDHSLLPLRTLIACLVLPVRNLPAIKVSSIFALPKNSNLLPHQAILMPIGDPFIELTTVDSTNNYAMAQVQNGTANHGTAYFAWQQTAGKGQRGKTWTTETGKNLILSVILEPADLLSGDSFLLSAAVANACCDFFRNYAGDESKIKWPNDIYWRDRKTGGILIENIIRNHRLTYSIVGIGLNINQTAFSSELVNPVSLKQITGESYNPLYLAKELCIVLNTHYNRIQTARPGIIEHYNSNLYKLDSQVKLRKANTVFETTIKGVSSLGRLVTKDAVDREFNFGEVEWLL
jgi:BirA family biotin operon repressor/biotin-[acetyl-CoA-carboxylase] ligase